MEREPTVDSLPLFPLDNVVLFPSVQVPLHIFEPRYRQMTSHALDGNQRIGMVALKGGGLDANGIPRVFSVGCEGSIEHSESLPDGRFNLLLAGRQRFRIIEEFPPGPGQLYRTARIAPLPDVLPSTTQERTTISHHRLEVMRHLDELLRGVSSELADEISSEILDRFDDGTFVNTLCQAIDFDPAEKQGLLETDSLLARIDQLDALLSFRLAQVRGGSFRRDLLH